VASETWLDRAAWSHRPRELGALGEYDDGRAVVAMTFAPTETLGTHWRKLSDLWLDLSPHPHILDALDRGADERELLLRYAALYWKHPRLHLAPTERGREIFASWGVQLTDAFEAIANQVPDTDLGRFLNPMVLIDLGHAARLAFLPFLPGDAVDSGVLPPDAFSTWPRAAGSTIVYVIGRALRDLCVELERTESSQLNAIVGRCLEPKPSDRYPTLGALRAAWIGAGAATDAIRTGDAFAAWDLAEEAAGWLAVGRTHRARLLFEDVLEIDLHQQLANAGLDRARELLEGVAGVPPQPPPALAWAEARPKGAKLEAEHAFAEAAALYQDVKLDGVNDAAIHTAISRCYLALGASGPAIDFAQRALAIASVDADALAVCARAYLMAHDYERALTAAEAWLAVAPDDAAAHYVRGRSLLSLARFAEARDAFDRAATLRPQMLEALLLRREADRAIRALQRTVGTQPDQPIQLPEHLAHLRTLLSSIPDLIDALAQYTDPVATLLRARCLAFEQRHAEAIVVFDQLGATRDASLGKAHSLLALERPADALQILDPLAASADLDVIEARALALVQLGRDAEAERELQRLVAASGGRSELRLKA